MRTATSMMLTSLALAACHGSSARLGPAPGYGPERDMDRSAVLLSSWRPPSPQRCSVALAPAALPPADALIATESVPALLDQGGIAGLRGSALLSLKFDSAGTPTRVRVVESELPDSAQRIIEQVVLSALQPQPAGRAWGVRLRIDLDSVPRYRVGRAEYCPATLLVDRRGPAMKLPAGPLGPAGMSSTSKEMYKVKYRLTIDRLGHVVEAETLDPGHVDPATVEEMRLRILDQRFAPELDDGVPKQVVIERTTDLTMVTVIFGH